jgi:hypothetical protein
MEPNIHEFREPKQCAYWDDPKPVRSTPMKEIFELIDTYAYESHLHRYLLKCRECGQLYFFEFYEWIDREHGNDPQYSKYIPVSTMDEVEMLKNMSPGCFIVGSRRSSNLIRRADFSRASAMECSCRLTVCTSTAMDSFG